MGNSHRIPKKPKKSNVDIIPEGDGLSPHSDIWQLSVEKKSIAKIIGRGGSAKKECENNNDVRIDILDAQKHDENTALILIRSISQSDDHSCGAACEMIGHLYANDYVVMQLPLPTEALVDCEGAILIAEELAKITKAKVSIFRENLGPVYGEVACCRVSGKAHPVRLACLLVGRDILGCGNLGVECCSFIIRKSVMGVLMGKGGSNIKRIRDLCPDADFDVEKSQGDSNCVIFGAAHDIETMKSAISKSLEGRQQLDYQTPILHMPDTNSRDSFYAENNKNSVNGTLDKSIIRGSVRASLKVTPSHKVIFPDVVAAVQNYSNSNDVGKISNDILAMRYCKPEQVEELKNVIYSVLEKKKLSGISATKFLRPLLDAVAHVESGSTLSESIFFRPDENNEVQKLLAHLDRAQTSIDVALFSITFDPLANALVDASKRGCHVRVITDDDQSCQQGSDIENLQNQGIVVKVDGLPFHMHHKFAVIDGTVLVNGSFNWTKQAVENNQENVCLTSDHRLVPKYSDHFEVMWGQYPLFDKKQVLSDYRKRFADLEGRRSGNNIGIIADDFESIG